MPPNANVLVGADKLVADSCGAAPPPSDLRLPPNENAGELATFGATAVSLLMAPPLIENAVVPDSPPADLTEASPNENVEALADTAASEAAGGLGLVTPNDDANAGAPFALARGVGSREAGNLNTAVSSPPLLSLAAAMAPLNGLAVPKENGSPAAGDVLWLAAGVSVVDFAALNEKTAPDFGVAGTDAVALPDETDGTNAATVLDTLPGSNEELLSFLLAPWLPFGDGIAAENEKLLSLLSAESPALLSPFGDGTGSWNVKPQPPPPPPPLLLLLLERWAGLFADKESVVLLCDTTAGDEDVPVVIGMGLAENAFLTEKFPAT